MKNNFISLLGNHVDIIYEFAKEKAERRIERVSGYYLNKASENFRMAWKDTPDSNLLAISRILERIENPLEAVTEKGIALFSFSLKKIYTFLMSVYFPKML